jgi:Heterokaryon incompatibility protein (HET)
MPPEGQVQELLLGALKNPHFPNARSPREVEFNHEDVTETESRFQSSGPTAYEFRPLYDDPRTIRLLILLPSKDWYSRIKCSLAIDALDNHPRYTALSYVWSDPGELASIFISGHRFDVMNNLHVALRHLRLKSEVRIL